MANFKFKGTWWNDNNIELVEIDGEVFALNGWDGEAFTKSWKCIGEFHMEASEELYIITPIYDKADEDEFDVVGYEVRKN